MRNFFVFMMVAQGTPMLYGGDEYLRTQLGNNNTYTPEADNPYSWHGWGAWLAKDEAVRMQDFVKNAIQFARITRTRSLPPTTTRWCPCGARPRWARPISPAASW